MSSSRRGASAALRTATRKPSAAPSPSPAYTPASPKKFYPSHKVNPLPSSGRQDVALDIRYNEVFNPLRLHPEHVLNPTKPLRAMPVSKAFDLGPTRREARETDIFQHLELKPNTSPMNPFLRTEFTSPIGQILSRGDTMLTRKNQRRIAKAIRRGRAMGVIADYTQSLPL